MAKHNELVDADLHVPGYVQAGDPGAVGAGVGWIDTSGGAGNWLWKIRNATDNGWEILVSAGGVTDFVDLDDTPAGYGTDGQVLTTNGTDTLSWGDIPTPATPLNYEGRPDGSFGIVCQPVYVNFEPSTTSSAADVVNSEPNGALTTFSFSDATGAAISVPALAGSVAFTATIGTNPYVITDNGAGSLSGAGPNGAITGTVAYDTGEWSITFNALDPPDTGTDITVTHDYLGGTATASVTAFDCIKAVHGGTGSYSYTISSGALGPNSDDDPTLAIITFTCNSESPGQIPVDINVYDYGLGATAYGQIFISLSDLNGFGCA